MKALHLKNFVFKNHNRTPDHDQKQPRPIKVRTNSKSL